jgi:hypothetical protein
MSLKSSLGLPILELEFPSFKAVFDARPNIHVGYVEKTTFWEVALFDPGSMVVAITRVQKKTPKSADQLLLELHVINVPYANRVDAIEDFVAIEAFSIDRTTMDGEGFIERVFEFPPVNCSQGSQIIEIGNEAFFNQLRMLSINFDPLDTPKSVKVEMVFGDNVRRWISIPDYFGDLLLITDTVAGPGMVIRVTVGEHAGSFDCYAIVKQKVA